MEIVINKLINQFTKGVSIYTHGDSTWLIFSESKQWVIELTGSKTLWYNYNFFQEIFHYASLDVVQNQHFITKWVEGNIINETKRTNGKGRVFNRRKEVESVIENGVKETQFNSYENKSWVEGVIKGGVKETKVEKRPGIKDTKIEDTIENGVKITSSLQSREYTGDIDEALQKGIRLTEYQIGDTFDGIEDIIENGVEETNWANHADPERIDEIIEGDIKRTIWANYADPNQIDEAIEGGIKETNYDTSQYIEDVTEVIENGIEEIYEVYWNVSNYVINDVVDNGVKNSNPLQYMPKEIINNVVENGITSTHDDIYHHRGRVDGVIKNGIKETEPQDDWVNTIRIVTEVIDEGIKKPTD